MKLLRLTLVALMLSLAGTIAYAQDAMTATCKDGTNWSGARRGGACRGHGGVQAFGAAATQPATPSAAPPTSFRTSTSLGAVANSRPTAAPGGNGQVWVNTKTKVYHCSTGQHYAKTKAGTYMAETAAVAAGNRPSRSKSCS